MHSLYQPSRVPGAHGNAASCSPVDHAWLTCSAFHSVTEQTNRVARLQLFARPSHFQLFTDCAPYIATFSECAMQSRCNWMDEHDADLPADAQATSTPLVSVVISCYNSARYLANTLNTVLSQTYQAVEIIVVDDGSIDATPQIAQSYPVTYVRQCNRGTSAARNKGLSLSHGRYVLFVNHDDRLLPCCIAAGVALLETHPACTVAVGEQFYIAADGTRLCQLRNFSDPRTPYLRLLERNFIETPCVALIRRSALLVFGGFCEALRGSDEHELFLRIARQSRVICHTTVVAECRLHSADKSRDPALLLTSAYRALQMEKPYLGRHPKRLRSYRKGVSLVERTFGRLLSVEVFRRRHPITTENRGELRLLLDHYPIGVALVALALLLPYKLRLIVTGALERDTSQSRFMEPSRLQQVGGAHL